jgi:hypothetical protein
MINKKIKLSLPQVKFTFAKILSAIDILTVLAIVFGVLASGNAESAIKLWITAVVILLASRIVRLLYFGASSFPQIKYDITLLTSITALLVLTLVQASSVTYASLSADNNWSVGVFLLSAVTLYLMQIVLNNFPRLRKFLVWVLGLAILLILINGLPSDITAMVSRASKLTMGINLVAISGVIIAISGLIQFKSTINKVLSLLLLVISLPFVISSIAQGQFMLVFLALLIFVVITPKTSLNRMKSLVSEIGHALSKKASLSLRSKIILFGAGAITILSIVSFLLKPQFITNSLQTLEATIGRFPGASEVILGLGLTPSAVDASSLLLSYGTLGLLAVSIFLASIIQQIRKVSIEGKLVRTAAAFTGAALVLYFLSMIFTETLSIAARIILLTSIALLFFEEMPARDKPFKLNFKFNKLMSAQVWQELFVAIRVLLTITVIILIPVAIDFVIAVF